jgi:deazaflavin-dependent oxidoreductase (nitroreductase family)
MVNNRLVIRVMSALHRFFYRLTGGALGGTALGVPILLLTTTGRKTGKSRTTPLMYLADGDDLVVVASNAGDAKHPAWWLSLMAGAPGAVLVKRERRHVVAREAQAEEKARLWPKLVAMYPEYARYQERTSRAIPVVVLKRSP